MNSDFKILKFFTRFCLRYKRQYLASFLLMPILAYLNILGPSFIQKIIDIGVKNKDLEYITTLSIGYLIVTIFIFIFSIIQNILLQQAGFHSLHDIRGKLISHILSFCRKDYDAQPSGVYVSRSISDVENIGETFLQGITYLITDLLTIIAIFAYIFYQNVYLGLVTFFFFPVLFYLLNWFRIKLRVIFNKIREINSNLTHIINETFTMFEEVKSFNLTPLKTKMFNKESNRYQEISIKSVKIDSWIYSTLDGTLFVTIGIIFFLATFFSYFNEHLSIGLFAAYILLLEKLFLPLKEMSGRFAALQSALAAINKIYTVFQIPPLCDKGVEIKQMNHFKLQNINFSYIKNIPVLKNINLEIKPNQSLGIVGPSGSGKSTLIKLFMRHYKIKEGSFLINDIDIGKLSLKSFKNKIAMIPQEPSIFSKDITFNISLGNPEMTLEKIKKICTALHIDNFIQKLPQGYQTILSDNGKQLSTGQRQLIALARAFISSANTIIFDEATANIDTQSELLIQEALQIMMGQKTIITIAHRLSTIRNCDKIIVIKSGEIVEEGNHQALIDKQGFYYHLLQVQKQGDYNVEDI